MKTKRPTTERTGIFRHERITYRPKDGRQFWEALRELTEPEPGPVAVVDRLLADALNECAKAGVIVRVKKARRGDFCFQAGGQCWKPVTVSKPHLRAMRRNLMVLQVAVSDFARCYREGKIQSACLSAVKIGRLSVMVPVRMFEPAANLGKSVDRGNQERRKASAETWAKRVQRRREAVRQAYREKRAKKIQPSAAVKQIVREGPEKIGLPATERFSERTIWRDKDGLK